MAVEKGEVDNTTSNVFKSNKKLIRIVGIVIGVAFVAGGIAAAVVLSQSGSDNSTSSSSSGDSSSGSDDSSTASPGSPCANTASASIISISEGTDGYRTITANGCPAYDTSGESTPNTATQMEYIVKLPTTPKISTSTTYIGVYQDKAGTIASANVPLGPVGIAINGVVLYGNGDFNKDDAYLAEGKTFDECKGHSDPSGAYHYHAEPGAGCVYTDSDGKHSPIFGLMLDGIPVFGVYGDGGAVPTDLDECNGHTDESYPFYHYHVTADYAYPYLINCMKGCIDYVSSTTDFTPRVGGDCTEATTQYDYSSLPTLLQAAL